MIDTISLEIKDFSTIITRNEYLFNSSFQKTLVENITFNQLITHSGEYDYQIAKGFIKSSEYKISYFYDRNRNIFRLEFSLQKLQTEHNIFMYPQNDIINNNHSLGINVPYIYDNLLFVIRKIYSIIFQIDDTDVLLFNTTIKRIDLCYNQIFDNEKDCREYLMYQKKIKKKATNEKTKVFNTWHNSIYIVTENYTFKIYHKGDEFKKNDYKRIKITDQKKADELLKYANRILRYEQGFRKQQLNIDCKRLIYNNELNKKYYKYYSIIKNSKEPEERLKQVHSFINYNIINKDDKKLIEIYKKYPLTEYPIKSLYKFYDKFNNKTLDIYLIKNNNSINKVHKYNVLSNLHLNKSSLKIMYKYFINNIKQFQLSSKVSILELEKRIVNYNTRVQLNKNILSNENKVRLSKYKNLFLLLNNYSIDELIKLNIYDRTTIYRYKKELFKFDIDINGYKVDKIYNKSNTVQEFNLNFITMEHFFKVFHK